MRGHLAKKKDQFYAVIFVDDKHKWIKLSQKDTGAAKDREKATKEMFALIAAFEAGTYRPPEKLTVQGWLDFWLNEICTPRTETGEMSPKTLKSYKETVALHLGPGLGKIRLDKLEPEDLTKYYNDKLKSGLSSTSVNYHARVLHAALHHARRYKKISDNPCELVTPPSKSNFSAELPTVEMMAAILDESWGSVLYMPTVLAMTTGARRGEILGLQWSDIDWQAGTARIKHALKIDSDGSLVFGATKTKQTRLVPLTTAAQSELKAEQRRQAELKLFYGPAYATEWNLICCWPDGGPINPDYLTRAWSRCKEKLNIESKTRFHDLRHNYATLLVESGIDVSLIAANLGHADPATARKFYIHPTVSAKKEAVSGLDQRLFGAIAPASE